MQEDEREIIKRCQSGDEYAFEQLFYRYQETVYNVAYRMMGNRQDAEDITQEVFSRVYQKLSSLKETSAFSTWLYRITSNLCVDEINKRKKQAIEFGFTQENLDTFRSDFTPEDKVIADEEQALLWEAINSLKAEHRIIIILRDIEGLSYKELKRELKCSMGRVKSRLHDARRKLRTILKEKIKCDAKK
ncbi:TPA: sigma-70 family RNA polymerase sigma factor [Candidatus Poribacteria bacterium]|nr:sigma-70 family RNA polymerase sigma factor [Candidatus Poribacteria bacterium]